MNRFKRKMKIWRDKRHQLIFDDFGGNQFNFYSARNVYNAYDSVLWLALLNEAPELA